MRSQLLAAFIAATCAPFAHAATLTLIAGPHAVPVAAPDGFASVRVTLVAEDGTTLERRFDTSAGAALNLGLASADGRYAYQLEFTGPAESRRPIPTTVDGRDVAAGRAWPSVTGRFAVLGGQLITPETATLEPDGKAAPRAKDVVVPDDQIVQGSLCVGFDCVDNESFGFATIRLKENNTRLEFDDTSTGAFAANDWQLIANDNLTGGPNYLGFFDVTASRRPFAITAGAPADALFVDSVGRVGFGIGVPTLKLHLSQGDTPATRFEQTNAGGFTAQTWDVAGNEANFFVRDVTGGSLLPFRIRPGAPTSSVDISASGNVGVGTASPTAKLDVSVSRPVADPPIALLRVSNVHASVPAGTNDRFVVDSVGNVTARGTIAQLSSRTQKHDFRTPDSDVLLAKLERLPVTSWQYNDAPAGERHIGPVAEDFHAAYDVGGNPRYLAPADVAGVALASVKALQAQVKQRDARIEQLEARLARLESLLSDKR
jgi:hypothetical protein